MRLLKVLVATAATLPILFWDFATVFVEGPGIDPEGPDKLLLPKVWSWALR